MTNHQLLALFGAAPFLTLVFAWLIGLACIRPQPKPIRVKVRRHD